MIETLTKTETKVEHLRLYKIILYNDDKYPMVLVVKYLMLIFRYGIEESTRIMEEAHRTGRSIVIITHLERAELYLEQMTSVGLIGSIEEA